MPIARNAAVSRRARLGHNVTIGPYCVVEDDVAIGDGCILGPHVVLLSGTTLGPRCRVHAGAVIGDRAQDFHTSGEASRVEIGAGTTIREHVTIHRASRGGAATRIGRDCLLMAGSHVGHDAVLGDEVTLVNHVLVGGHAQIGDRAVLGGAALVHQFVRIGRLAMMSGGSAVQMDVPPFCMTRSVSANAVMSLNVVGLRRAGVSPDERRRLQNAFRTLYRSGLNTKEALTALDQDASPLVRELVEFVRGTSRGICKPAFDERHEPESAGVKLRLVG